ncbi:MAG TPA: L-seryl-tRNA(Sec) selenium transferase [Deltaproteobacteria bacterium]|nr:L-seryl-tRNA(Sec) selenium transferase [Deltaproteobacteria bacterium]
MPDKKGIQGILRKLPAVDQVLKWPEIKRALGSYPRKLVLKAIREILDERRKQILDAPDTSEAKTHADDILPDILKRLEKLSEFTLIPLVNATGIIVHTNLGRSLLAEEALERLELISSSYSNLEYDLEAGQRGSRYVHAESILCELTGAEAALVVNNNAGAVLLVLNTLALGKEVIVSRGQLVEIGGAFRIPDVMERSGARLRDVGCTNRTHLRDYEEAINENTALLMKVHNSNYMIVGFTKEVPLQDLVELAHRHNLYAVEDLGSGSFIDLSQYGLRKEPTAQEAVECGVDVVTFSGDKLLGGPQAGIILGRKELIARFKKNPLTRALRIDKLTLAALEATLRLYRDFDVATKRIPTLRMITTPMEELTSRAVRLKGFLDEVASTKFEFVVEDNFSQVGGGALPGQNIPTKVVSVTSQEYSVASIEKMLRSFDPPIIGRIEHEKYLLDVRTMSEKDFDIVRSAFARIAR